VQSHVHRAACRIRCACDIEGDARSDPRRLQADEASAVRALLLLTALIALGTESLQ
jgi:hypothetical protein